MAQEVADALHSKEIASAEAGRRPLEVVDICTVRPSLQVCFKRNYCAIHPAACGRAIGG